MVDYATHTSRFPDRSRRYLWLVWLLLAGLLFLSWWLRVEYMWRRLLDFDEALLLAFGLLVNSGHPAYTDTFVVIAPLALLSIQLGAKLFGTFLAFRYPLMLFSLIGIGGIFLNFQPWQGLSHLTAGFLAAVLLSFEASYFYDFASIWLEAPAVAMSIVSILLAQQFYFRQKRYWLFGSGLTFALSLALKPFVIFIPLLVGFLIIYTEVGAPNRFPGATLKQIFLDGVTWLLGVAIPLVIIFLFYNPQAMYQEIIGIRLALREVYLKRGYGPLDNLAHLKRMLLIELRYLSILSLVGILVGWRQQRLQVLLWGCWLILATGLLFWQIPLRPRYVVMLTPSLVVLSSIALSWGIDWLSTKPKRQAFQRILLILPVLALTIYALSGPLKEISSSPRLDSNNYIFSEGWRHLEVADYLKTILNPDDCIITDDQRFTVALNRYPPPFLSEISRARTRSGWMLTSQDITRAVEEYECPVVIYTHLGLPSYLPDLAPQLRNLYFLEIAYSDRIRIFTANKNVNHQPQVALNVKFGDTIQLKGLDLASDRWQPGQKVHLTTYWSALKPPDQAYKIFLHLKNRQGQTVANFDHFPFPVPDYRYRFFLTDGGPYKIIPTLNPDDFSHEVLDTYPTRGMVPTTVWPVGQTIKEVTLLHLPADLPEGNYQLFIGMYQPDSQLRLPLDDDRGQNGEFLLAPVEVVNKQ